MPGGADARFNWVKVRRDGGSEIDGRAVFHLRKAVTIPNVRAVKLSVKSDYAARAVYGLARKHHAGKAVRVESLAAEQGIPPKYLVQILIELKSQRIVRSVRGKEGGYLLAREPGEISLGDVLRCIHGQVFDSSGLSDSDCAEELRGAWEKLQSALDDAADSITFQKLVEEGAAKQEMYYI